MEVSPGPGFKDGPGDGGIMNRKRELKGLPSSFSSNLGCRVSPPRQAALHGVTLKGSRSVKSIVAWIESSPSNAGSPNTSQDDSTCALARITPSPSGAVSLQAEFAPPVTSEVEEYSLTLLRYRSYFTDRPLGRCLDESPPKDHEANAASSMRSSRGSSLESVGQDSANACRLKEGRDTNNDGAGTIDTSFQHRAQISLLSSSQPESQRALQHQPLRTSIEVQAF
ncbi:hypothetical protein HJFPF1_03711 [Paramyrothecium foliicola]|nr:hypothetical protein HJFPF1_03711 [Paramyrothecium foliicola]